MTGADLLPATVLKRKLSGTSGNRRRPRSRSTSKVNVASTIWSTKRATGASAT